MPLTPDVCGAESPAGVFCERAPGHDGRHGAWLRWHELPGRHHDEDETPTVQFPPIGQTIRRRPPVPAARVVELTGRVELLQALGRELQRELAELRDDDEDQADDDGALAWPPCEAGVILGRECQWPATGHPCLGYGSVGCGMKAQES